MTRSELSSVIRSLDREQKLALLDELWGELTAELERAPMPDAHREEIDRRLERTEADPKAGASWAEVRERLTGNRR